MGAGSALTVYQASVTGMSDGPEGVGRCVVNWCF
jgi:hypothetical protein